MSEKNIRGSLFFFYDKGNADKYNVNMDKNTLPHSNTKNKLKLRAMHVTNTQSRGIVVSSAGWVRRTFLTNACIYMFHLYTETPLVKKRRSKNLFFFTINTCV